MGTTPGPQTDSMDFFNALLGSPGASSSGDASGSDAGVNSKKESRPRAIEEYDGDAGGISEALLEALSDTDESVRFSVERALLDIGNQRPEMFVGRTMDMLNKRQLGFAHRVALL